MAPLAERRPAARHTEKAALDPSPAPVGNSDHTVTVKLGKSLEKTREKTQTFVYIYMAILQL